MKPRGLRPSSAQCGFSLIELMIAMLLTFIVAGVLLTVVQSIANANRIQDGVAKMQDSARFALATIASDVRHAAGRYCSNYAMGTSFLHDNGVAYVDDAAAMTAWFDVSADPWRIGSGPNGATFRVDPATMLFGAECDADSCQPALSSFGGLGSSPLPAMGVNAGDRARGADVLGMRYLSGAGVRILAIESATEDGQPTRMRLAQSAVAAALPPTGSAVMLADCSVALLARVAPTDGDEVRLLGNFQDDRMPTLDVKRQARAFILDRDLRSVAYYLRLREDADPTSGDDRLVSTLVRRVDGTDMDLVDGVERFDVLYEVEDLLGLVRFVNADELQTLGSDKCRPAPNNVNADPASCGWRSVKSMHVHLLLNTIQDVVATKVDKRNDDAFRYSWLNDGTPNTSGKAELPSQLSALRNGLPPGRMLRREFHTVVDLRGLNH